MFDIVLMVYANERSVVDLKLESFETVLRTFILLFLLRNTAILPFSNH
jgi:hypothetical protein